MEIYQLKSFVAIAEEKNLTRAAKRLFTSQPAISAQIKSLEEELGISLFVRKSKGMELSPAGVELQQDAHNILVSIEQMQQKARLLNDQIAGVVRFGLNGDSDLLQISKFLAMINETSSAIESRFYQGNSGDILLDIQHGNLDIGTVYGDNTNAEIELDPLSQITFSVAGAYKWKAELEKATPEKLAQLPWIWPVKQCPCYEYVRIFYQKYGYEISNRVHANATPLVDSLIYGGSGLGVIRREKALPAQQERRLYVWKEDEMELPISIAYLKRRAEDPLIQMVRQIIHQIWDSPSSQKEAKKKTK